MMSFGDPVYLLFLCVPIFAFFLYRHYLSKKKSLALKFSSLGIAKSVQKRSFRRDVPFVLLMLALVLLVLGFADPLISLKQAKEGVNVILVIDDSGSMAANDYQPTRLEAAKKAGETLIKDLDPKDNVGIVIFESGATTAAYLTPFKDRALDKLKAIEQKEGRTAIGDGLSMAIDMAISIPNKKKVVILLSDGVNNAGVVTPEEAIAFAKSNKIQVHSVALGSEKPAVLGYDFFGNPQYAELDEKTLQMIARETGGNYYKSVNDKTLDDIYGKIGKEINREWEQTSIRMWFFGASFAVLVFLMYVIYGRWRIVI